MNIENRTLVIAEIGTAHQGSLSKAKELIMAASEAGADCIKFQWVYANEILHPKTGMVELPGGKISLYERFKQLEVNKDFFMDVIQYVHSLKKTFMCSPFGIRSLEELLEINPDYIKIASPELNHMPMLHKLVELMLARGVNNQIPVVLSSGVSTIKDIEEALFVLKPIIQHVSLLHCVTSYPAPSEDYNLSVLPFLYEHCNIPIGISDHSLDPILVPVLSLAYGSKIIEKHITLSKSTDGLDDPVALTPGQFSKMTESIRKAEKMSSQEIINYISSEYSQDIIAKTIGNGEKKLAESEKNNYGRTNRSIHVMRDMHKGEIITKSDIAILRTEKELSIGLSPSFYGTVIGKALTRDVHDGEGLTQGHFD